MVVKALKELSRRTTGIPWLLCLAGLAALSAGCFGDRATLLTAEVEATRKHVDYVVREVRAEEAAIRQELATTRIAAAKKEAELQDSRRQVAELQRAAEAKQAELAALRTDRDQQLQTRTKLESQLADLPQGRPAQSGASLEASATEALMASRVQELEMAVAALTVELARVKQNLSSTQLRSPRKPVRGETADVILGAGVQTRVMHTIVDPGDVVGEQERRPSHGPAVQPLSGAPRAGQASRITVRAGESLWIIARQHGVTVQALKEANGLAGDLIREGEELVIPESR
jgi:LysM repeat protein